MWNAAGSGSFPSPSLYCTRSHDCRKGSLATYWERLTALGTPGTGWTSLALRRGMQHPLRSASATPDSATGWEAVDREIEQLAQQGRMDESKAAKLAEGADDVEDGREAPPPPGEGDHGASDDAEALHAEAEQYIRRLDPEEQTRKVILLACACCLSIGRCVPSFHVRSLSWRGHFCTYGGPPHTVTMQRTISVPSRTLSARASRALPAL